MLLPCFMLRSTSLHAYMFRSTCFIPYAVFSYALFLFFLQVDVRVTCSHACMMLLAMPCLDLHVCMYILCSHAYIYVFTCLYAWICVLSCFYLHIHMLTCTFTCLHAYIRTSMCRSMFSTFLDRCSLHTLCYLSCACALHAVFACINLGYVVMLCAIVTLLSLCLSFTCFGLMVRTQSRPYGLCHFPYTKAHIKGFGSPQFHVYACLLLCFMLVLASLVLGFATLDALSGFVVLWLHLMPMRPCLDVTIWDASP